MCSDDGRRRFIEPEQRPARQLAALSLGGTSGKRLKWYTAPHSLLRGRNSSCGLGRTSDLFNKRTTVN